MEKNIDIDVEGLKAQCICPGCPSYVNCGEPIAFCLISISKCIKTEQGCICSGCPVYEKKVRSGLLLSHIAPYLDQYGQHQEAKTIQCTQ
jgi:hypothetical protein